jgi:hypothetical protein
MEMFGILLSIPGSFLASLIYAALVVAFVRPCEPLRRAFLAASIGVMGLLAVEVALLVRSGGALGARAAAGPAFAVGHLLVFVLGTPALANLLVLGRRASLGRLWWLAAFPCMAFAVALVLLQFSVSEALYGPDGASGPYADAPAVLGRD